MCRPLTIFDDGHHRITTTPYSMCGSIGMGSTGYIYPTLLLVWHTIYEDKEEKRDES